MPLRIPSSTFRSTLLPSVHSRRTLTSTARRFLKEDADRSPEQIEKKKQEQLKKQERGEGHWHEELGSQSESHIAADRQEVKDHGSHMEDLQKETAKKGEKGELEVRT